MLWLVCCLCVCATIVPPTMSPCSKVLNFTCAHAQSCLHSKSSCHSYNPAARREHLLLTWEDWVAESVPQNDRVLQLETAHAPPLVVSDQARLLVNLSISKEKPMHENDENS